MDSALHPTSGVRFWVVRVFLGAAFLVTATGVGLGVGWGVMAILERVAS